MSHSGKIVGNYRILERLGGGGMGVVYRAVDERLGRQAAVKFLPPQLTEDREARERFLVEAQAASKLEHPNVCPVYEAGETEDGRMYLAMALYEGETLRRRIERGPLDLDMALRLATEVCRGLSRAHEEGIIHRDIKPANVMLTERGEAKIVDFGLARLGEGARLTRTGSTMGTPAYMPPEQIRGEEVDPRADVWAVGVLLYEMLTGELPFAAGSDSGMVYAILNEEPSSLRERRPELPAELDAILARALAKDLDGRYPSVGELLSDLEAMRESGELATLPRMTPQPASRAGWRPWAGWAAAAAAVLLVALVFFGRRAPESHVEVGSQKRGVSILAVMPFTFRGSPEYDYLGTGMVDLLGTKLDGAGDLRSVDTHAVLGFVARQASDRVDRSVAERTAANFAADLFVVGEILEAGGRLHVSASLYRAGETEAFSRAVEEGDAEEIFELVDDLAAVLVADLLSGPGAGLARIAAVTTDSLPALKLYLAGERALRSGRFPEALESFQAAVEEDPQFALAWYRLSVAAEWASRPDLLFEAARQATRFSDRLSERNRRLLEARLVSRDGGVAEAEKLYRAILESYPDDVESWVQLAELQIHYGPLNGRPGAESRGAWERVLELEPNNASALWHLVRIVSFGGDRAALDATVERLLALNPDSNRILEIQAIRAYALDDHQEQQRVLDRLSTSPSEVIALAAWNVAIATHDVAGVSELLAPLTEASRPPDVRAFGHAAQAFVEVGLGRPGKAREHLESASRLAPGVTLAHETLVDLLPFLPENDLRLEALYDRLQAWNAERQPAASNPTIFFAAHDGLYDDLRLYLLGSIDARLGAASAADRAAAIELREATSRLGFLRQALANSVRAQIALSSAQAATALEALDSTKKQVSYQDALASPFLSGVHERYLRAVTLEQLGRPEEAIRWFSSFTENSFWDAAYLAPSHYRRAELCERLGRGEDAVEHYRRFLELWAEAEPELRPWVERARAKLEAAASPASGS